MADDTKESSTLAVLSRRVDFCGWQQSMLLYAIEKGDVDKNFNGRWLRRGGVEETARQIARTRFKVALMAFEEQSTKGDIKAGFETYADGIRVAEQKLAHAGVIMSDEEKKEKFFAGFNPRSAQWNSVKTFWMQSNHTFDDLSRGVQQQHSLDAVEAEDNASGVRSL